MLPANLTPLEVLDLGIFNEALTYQTYDRLGRRVEVATLQAKLSLLKKDEKDHRKTLKAHRRSMFASAPIAVSEQEARRIFGVVDVGEVRDKDSLLRTLAEAIKAEEYGAYFYERMKDRLPDREARIFFEVLASEGKFHSDILKQQVALIRAAKIAVDEHGRAAEIA
jgi:rubrerythrin